jgi:hypothetical protein
MQTAVLPEGRKLIKSGVSPTGLGKKTPKCSTRVPEIRQREKSLTANV